MGKIRDRIPIHLERGIRRSVDPGDIYFIEAVEGGSRVRLRGARPLFDVRLAGELARALRPFGFVRVHRDYLVNLRRVREIRRRSKGRDWELKLSSPVNRVLPVSRRALKGIWSAFEGG